MLAKFPSVYEELLFLKEDFRSSRRFLVHTLDGLESAISLNITSTTELDYKLR